MFRPKGFVSSISTHILCINQNVWFLNCSSNKNQFTMDLCFWFCLLIFIVQPISVKESLSNFMLIDRTKVQPHYESHFRVFLVRYGQYVKTVAYVHIYTVNRQIKFINENPGIKMCYLWKSAQLHKIWRYHSWIFCNSPCTILTHKMKSNAETWTEWSSHHCISSNG